MIAESLKLLKSAGNKVRLAVFDEEGNLRPIDIDKDVYAQQTFKLSPVGLQTDTVIADTLLKSLGTLVVTGAGPHAISGVAVANQALTLYGASPTQTGLVVDASDETPETEILGLRLDAPASTSGTQKARSPHLRLRATKWTGSASEAVDAFLRHNVAGPNGPGSYIAVNVQGEQFRFLSQHGGSTDGGFLAATGVNLNWLVLGDLAEATVAWRFQRRGSLSPQMDLHLRKNGVTDFLVIPWDDPADTETALMVRRNVGGTLTLQRVSMGAVDSGGAGFKLLRVPN